MKFILTCSNGKQIDMSSYVLKQMEGKITRKQVEQKILYYQKINKNKYYEDI